MRRLSGIVLGLAASLLLVGAARAGELTLYTSQPNRIAAETVAAFEKADPGVHVRVFRSGTTQVMNKLAAEFLAGSPQADVLLIADAMSMQSLKQQGRLLADKGQDVSALPPDTYDSGRTYFGTKLITTGIVYHKGAPFVPRSWNDLLRPAARGQVVLPSPLYSGAAMITAGAFTENPAIGPDYFKKLAANKAISVSGNGGVLNQVESGARDYGIVVDFMALNAYLASRDMKADWKSVMTAPGEALVNALAMMCPFEPAEKQALLEAQSFQDRASTLMALLEFGGESGPTTLN